MEVSISIACYNGAACSPRLVSCLNEFHGGEQKSFLRMMEAVTRAILLRDSAMLVWEGREIAPRAAFRASFYSCSKLLSWKLVRWTPNPQFPPIGRLPYRIAERWLGGEAAEGLASWKRRMMQSRKTIIL